MIIIVLSLLKLYKIIQIKYSIFDDYIDDKIIGITMQSSISSRWWQPASPHAPLAPLVPILSSGWCLILLLILDGA